MGCLHVSQQAHLVKEVEEQPYHITCEDQVSEGSDSD